jgi:hypothetical protein
LVTSSRQETFQTKLKERYLKFYSFIDLDNYIGDSYYEEIEFPDCGETTLRNFVKIISTNKKNKIDLEILRDYGASFNLIKYFMIYDENDFKNKTNTKPFSLDIDIYELSDKIRYNTNLTTEELEYLKDILDKNETEALFNIYKNKIVDSSGSSSITASTYEVNDINEFKDYLVDLTENIPPNISDNDKEYNFINAWNLLVSNLTGIKYDKKYKICEIKGGLNNDGKVNILEVLKKLFPSRNFDSFKDFPLLEDDTLKIEEDINRDGIGLVRITKKIIEEKENSFILHLQPDHFFIENDENDENTEYLSFEDCSSLTDKECFYLKFIGPYETNLFNNLEEILKIFNYNKFFYLYRKITNNEKISEIIQNNYLTNLIITKGKKNIYVNYLKYLINLDNNDLLKRMIFDCDYIDYFDDVFKVDKNGEMIIYPKLINFNFNYFNFRNPDVIKKLIIDKEIHRKYNKETNEDNISFHVTDLELRNGGYNKNNFEKLFKDQFRIDLSNMNFSGIEILKIYFDENNFDGYVHNDFYYKNHYKSDFYYRRLRNITELYLINYKGYEIPKLHPSIEKLEIELSYWKNFDNSNLNIISTFYNLKELNITIHIGGYDDETIQLLKDKIIFTSFNVVKTKLIFYNLFSKEKSTLDYYFYPPNYENLMNMLNDFNNIDQNKKIEIITNLNNVDQETINNYIMILLNNFDNIDQENKIQLMSYILNNINKINEILNAVGTKSINNFNISDQRIELMSNILNNIDEKKKIEIITILNIVDPKTISNSIRILLNNFGNINVENKIQLLSYIIK